MNVLILGDEDATCVDFIKYCVLPLTKHITFYMESSLVKYDDFYRNNGIKCLALKESISKHLGRRYARGRGFRFLLKQMMKRQLKEEKYDVIIVQFVTLLRVQLALELRRYHNSKVILSFWGSDLLRADSRKLKRIGENLQEIDLVACASLIMIEKFKQIYPKFDEKKLKHIWMGSEILEEIDKLQNGTDKTKKQIKIEWQIPQDSILVAIGYNGVPQQQHLEILKVFRQIPRDLLNKVCLLFQMTYGGTDEYKEQVIKEAEELGTAYKIIDSYLDNKEVAKIRIATDIFIHGQTTDALSGSIRENLYCGNIVVNAKWLHYLELDKFEIDYIEYDNFDDLQKVICDILEGKMKIETSGNKDKVKQFCSWEAAGKEWGKILGEM